MLFSKSFDYALRGVLYLSVMNDTRKRIQVEEISRELSIPKHFLGKVMNKLVKKGVIDSTKGPFGGLSMNDKTMDTSILLILKAVDGIQPFNSCVLKMRKCNEAQPCALHDQIASIRDKFYETMSNTTISELVNGNKTSLVQRISVN
jgi:Rrf2 family protein